MRLTAFVLSFLTPAAAFAHGDAATHTHAGVSAPVVAIALTAVLALVWGPVLLRKAIRK